MRKLIMCAAAMLCVAAAWASEPVVTQVDETKYALRLGNLTMDIDSRGGKILSFRYDEKEVLSQSKWPESFGSTFWTSPQKEWNWPPVQEFDKGAYAVEMNDSTLVMTGEVSAKLRYRIRKVFAVDAVKNAVVVTYYIINESDEERKVAPWEVTRVPNGGMLFFDAPVDSIVPSGLLPFQSEYDVAWCKVDVTQSNRKINADGKGWLGYVSDGLLLVKHFPDLPPSQPAPDEAEIQVYINRGKTYMELESQGAYTVLKPGESLEWTVEWFLRPVSCEEEPSRELLEYVRELL